MTNSHEPMRIREEIPPRSGEDSIEEQDIRVLDLYGQDESEKLTLVGLGPPRRKPTPKPPLKSASLRTSSDQLQPQSEPPGPWGSHGADDDEPIPPSLRRSKLGIWAVAVPLIAAVAGMTIIALRGLNPGAHRPSAADATAPVATVDNNAGLFVRVTEKDARVSVDGQDRGTAPMLVMGLAPGAHALTITLQGYETFEQPVLLVQNQVSTIEPMLTPQATKEPEPAPIAVADLRPTSKKFGGTTKAAYAAPAPTTKPLSVVLAENMAAERQASGTAATPPASPLPPTSDLPSPSDKGKLSISSNPPAAVVVDGRPLGRSPRTVDLPAGAHTVVFIHPQEGRRSVSVNVIPGRETSASVEF
jgi:hypothetical protein